MFDDNGMLTDQARGILFWVTLTVIVIIAVIAVITILRACSGLASTVEPPLTISPGEYTLCSGAQQQFTVQEGDEDIEWAATGGTVENGLFTAGPVPGDYTVTATGSDSGREAVAVVHVAACTPTPTAVPPTAAPTATPTSGAVVSLPDDAQDDVATFDGGAPTVAVPVGMDLRSASVGEQLSVVLQPTAGVPEALAGFAGADDVLVWIVLHDPLPDTPTQDLDWVFVLDLDGNQATGRLPGQSVTGLDAGLGDEVVLALRSRGGTYEPYWLIWSAGQQNYVERTDTIRSRFGDSNTLIGLAVPLETLAQAAGVTPVPGAAKGRAGTISYSLQLVDLYPE